MSGTSIVLRGDARSLPLPDESVDLIVTSPPYFALRSYTDGGEAFDGQIGAEPTVAEYLDVLLEVTAECARVLKPTGSLFVNIGDKYASRRRGPNDSSTKLTNQGQHRPTGPRPRFDVPQKSLLAIPARYSWRVIDELGLLLRAEIIWSKSNGLPESVTDRVRRAHEQVFHFTKEPQYFSAVDEIRDQLPSDYRRRNAKRRNPPGQRPRGMNDTVNPLGRLPGSVWHLPTQPLNVPAHLEVDHFAAFPPELVRRIVEGWSPARGICIRCGHGRAPVVTGSGDGTNNNPYQDEERNGNIGGADFYEARDERPRVITGYDCRCPDNTAPTRPAIVLDPFGGTGTTAMVAKALGRVAISIDLSADYCRLARWRINESGHDVNVRARSHIDRQGVLL